MLIMKTVTLFTQHTVLFLLHDDLFLQMISTRVGMDIMTYIYIHIDRYRYLLSSGEGF